MAGISAQYIRLNLASAIFPFFTAAAGRTIIIPGSDENFDRYNAANTTPDKGVPQVFYMHNSVPTNGGFQSVGYIQSLPGFPGGADDFDTCFPLFDTTPNTFLFVPANGKCYVYDGGEQQWIATAPSSLVDIPPNTLVTVAYVGGTSYIYFGGIGCYSYNSSTKTMDPVTLTGLSETDVVSICAANGYMIACTNTAVAWSSLTDPTDFTPSIVTGAGGGEVQDAKGPIQYCVSIPGGFTISCQKNIVGATYTANTSFPFIIKEVTGSGGVNSIDDSAYQGNLPYHVIMTTSGIQQVSLDSAIPTMPEVSEFLTSKIFEDFEETTQAFSSEYTGSQ